RRARGGAGAGPRAGVEPVACPSIAGDPSRGRLGSRRGEVGRARGRPPLRVPEGRNESMLREYRVLAALRDTDVPHARVLACCDDPSVLGACFFLMEYVDGWSCMSTGGWPPPFDTDLEARQGLAWELVDAIAQLARGAVLMGWPDPDEERAHAGYVDYTGMPSRAELCERYARGSGLPVDEIDYYVILARFKIAIVLEGGYARYVQGGADNPKMAAFGDVVLDMARKAAELARTTPLRR